MLVLILIKLVPHKRDSILWYPQKSVRNKTPLQIDVIYEAMKIYHILGVVQNVDVAPGQMSGVVSVANRLFGVHLHQDSTDAKKERKRKDWIQDLLHSSRRRLRTFLRKWISTTKPFTLHRKLYSSNRSSNVFMESPSLQCKTPTFTCHRIVISAMIRR